MGQGEPPDGTPAVPRAPPAHARLPSGQGPVRAGLLRRRRSRVPDADPRHHRDGVAQPVRPQHVHPGLARGAPLPRAPVRRAERAGLPRGSRDGRHAVRGLHRAELRGAARPRGRHAVRGRDQEVDLHGDELPAPAAGRAVHARLGQRRLRRRRGRLLRAVGNRQDDAVGRPGPRADRRRRARLERSRRLQHRRRLLRQGDPTVGERRARDPRDDAALRHDPRERRLRLRDGSSSTSTTTR